MIRRGMTLGWLVGAAALLFAGCSSEDDTIAGEPKTTEPTAQATVIRVTVGAGISDGEATTRSTVVKEGSTRTLQFTTGDKLYVWGSYGSMEKEPSGTEYYDYIVAGYLDLDTESFDASNPTNATFTGELTVYSWVNEMGHDEVLNEEAGDFEYMVDENGYYTPASSSPSFSTADPLGECNDVTGTLIHKDAVKDVDYVISEGDRMVYYRPDCAATVEELMTTKLWVSGDYDSGTKSFALEKDRNQPIVNCTISGLEAGVSYKVDYIYGTTAAMSDHSRMLYSSMEATGGTLAFAFIAETGDKFHGIRLTNTAEPTDTYDASIGRKAFASKVYNAARTAVGKKTPLTIEAITGGNIEVYRPKSGMRYKINDGEMITWTGNLTWAEKTITVVAGDKVQFYGNGTTITSYSGTRFNGGTAQVKVYGNIMSLVDETGFATATTLTAEKAFYQLFYNYSALKDVSGLLLPATTLSSNCYERMFVNCDNLTAAPALPATTLADNCYDSMFIGCTSLTAAPALPATTMASNCYNAMFGDCTSLTAAPALPATTLASNCYNAMFEGCTSLATAPALPATTLASNCYDYMFKGCTSLTTAPALRATTLADRCYKQMFEGCTSLTTVPATLPATTLASYCCYQMFQDCTSLTTVPEQLLPATTLAEGCYERMFWNCTNLTAAPALPAVTLAEGCYNKMFGQCTSLTAAPALCATTLADRCYDSMFNGCTNLSSVTCLATDISALDCTDNWLSGVAATGTFTKASTMTSWTTGSASGIPTGWTVVDAQ